MCGPNGPNLQLVGGWTNPFEKYDRQNGCIFPKFRGEHEKKWQSCHHRIFNDSTKHIHKLQKNASRKPPG